MKPLLFDLLSSFRSKLTIGIVLLILLISILGSGNFKISEFQTDSTSANLYSVYYYENGSYHIINFIYNTYGDPIGNIEIQALVDGSIITLNTSAQGFANFSYSMNGLSARYTFLENYSYLGTNYSYPITLTHNDTSPGYNSYDGYLNYHLAIPVNNPSNPFVRSILIIYVGNNGSKSPPSKIYITSGNNRQTLIGQTPSFYVYKANLGPAVLSPGSLYQITVMNVTSPPPKPLSGTVTTGYQLEIADPSHQLAIQASSFIEGFYGTIIGLASLFISYSYYGKLRTTGTIEGVISKPISRRELFLSRYLAATIVMAIESVVAVTSMDLFAHMRTGFYIPTTDTTLIFMAIFLSASSVTGVFMNLSNFLRTDISMIGISVAIALVLTLLWGGVIQEVNLAFGLTGYLNAAHFVTVELLLYYLNPMGGIILSATHITGSLPSALFPVSLSELNPYPSLIVLQGVVWILATFSMGLFLSKRSD